MQNTVTAVKYAKRRARIATVPVVESITPYYYRYRVEFKNKLGEVTGGKFGGKWCKTVKFY